MHVAVLLKVVAAARCLDAFDLGEDRLGALLLHETQSLVDLEDDRDGRRERRLAVDRGIAVRPRG